MCTSSVNLRVYMFICTTYVHTANGMGVLFCHCFSQIAAGTRAMMVGSAAGCGVIGLFTLAKYFSREKSGSVFDYV